jgi:hypothetical protein
MKISYRFASNLIAIAKGFFRYGTCSESLNPPYPPFSKAGNLVACF